MFQSPARKGASTSKSGQLIDDDAFGANTEDPTTPLLPVYDSASEPNFEESPVRHPDHGIGIGDDTSSTSLNQIGLRARSTSPEVIASTGEPTSASLPMHALDDVASENVELDQLHGPYDDPAAMKQFIEMLNMIHVYLARGDMIAANKVGALLRYLRNPVTSVTEDGVTTTLRDTMEKQWATASLDMEDVLHYLNAQGDAGQYAERAAWHDLAPARHPQRRDVYFGFIKKNIANLVRVSGARWAECAHGAVIGGVTDHLLERWKFAYTDSTTYSALGGVSLAGLIPGMPQWVKGAALLLGVSFHSETTLDDENYPAEATLYGGSVTGTLDAGLATANGAFSYQQGTYEEWGDPKNYALMRLPKIEKEIRALRPLFAAHKSRYASCGRATPLRGLGRYIGTDDNYQLERHDDLRQQFNLDRDHIAQSLAVMRSVMGAAASSSGEPFGIAPIRTEKGSSVILNMKVWALDGKGSAGLDFGVASFGVGGELTSTNYDLELKRRHSLIKKQVALEAMQIEQRKTMLHAESQDMPARESHPERLPRPETMDREAMLTAMESVIDQTDIYLETVRVQIEDKAASKNAAIRSRKLEEQREATLTKVTLAHDLARRVREEGVVPVAPQQAPGGTVAQPPALTGAAHLSARLRALRLHFREYSRMQMALDRARTESEKDVIRESIQQFHAMVGARDTEHFLYSLTLLNADFYRQASRAGWDDIKQETLELEQRFIDPLFKVDRKRLEEMTSYTTVINLGRNDVKGAANSGIMAKIFQFFNPTATASAVRSKRWHPNPFRMATIHDIEIRIPAIVMQGSREDLLDIIEAQLSKDHVVDRSSDAWLSMVNQLDLSAGAGVHVVLLYRRMTPALFDVGDVPMFVRCSSSREINLLSKDGVGTGGGGVVGGGYASTVNQFRSEDISEQSLWYPLVRFSHDYMIDQITETDGQLHFDERALWRKIQLEQRPHFRNLLANAGRGALKRELDGLDGTFRRLGLTAQQAEALQAARTRFETLTRAFSEGAGDFEQCMQSMEWLLFQYSKLAPKLKAISAQSKEQDESFALTPANAAPVQVTKARTLQQMFPKRLPAVAPAQAQQVQQVEKAAQVEQVEQVEAEIDLAYDADSEHETLLRAPQGAAIHRRRTGISAKRIDEIGRPIHLP